MRFHSIVSHLPSYPCTVAVAPAFAAPVKLTLMRTVSPVLNFLNVRTPCEGCSRGSARRDQCSSSSRHGRRGLRHVSRRTRGRERAGYANAYLALSTSLMLRVPY